MVYRIDAIMNFNPIVMAKTYFWSFVASDLYWPTCFGHNATLGGHRQVEFQCNDNDMNQSKASLIMYPLCISSIDLQSNNIVRIVGRPFQRFGNIA